MKKEKYKKEKIKGKDVYFISSKSDVKDYLDKLKNKYEKRT